MLERTRVHRAGGEGVLKDLYGIAVEMGRHHWHAMAVLTCITVHPIQGFALD